MLIKNIFKVKVREKGKNNKINICKNINNLNIKIKLKGNNNNITIEDLGDCWKKSKLTIVLTGDDCNITINKGFMLRQNLDILCQNVHAKYGKLTKSNITIGKDTSMVSGEICIQNSNVDINIGDECMFSRNFLVYATDGHPIYDINTDALLNKIKGITIGNKCWIGQNVSIFKNVIIKNSTIVGSGSVVTKVFDKENCAIAGNPAKLIKEGIYWKRGSKEYIENK